MNLISEYEPPQSIRVQCEAFRILGSYKGDSDLDKEALLDDLFMLCSNESDFRDVFYAAYTLSLLRMNNTEIFDYVMSQLLLRDKLLDCQPLNLSKSTIQYFYENGITCEDNDDQPSYHEDSELIKIISEDNLQEFINYSLYHTNDNVEVKIGEKFICGSKLVVSCAFNAENIVRHLIPLEKDLTSALMIAAAYGYFSLFRLLEQCGADISLAYDIAVYTHQYEIIDYIRFNSKNIQPKDNIELESNNILAYLTKENDEIEFNEALIVLRNGNISFFKYIWGEKAPPPWTTFLDIANEILYLSVCGEYDLVRGLISSEEMDPLKTNDTYSKIDMFVYSGIELSSKIFKDQIVFFDDFSLDMLASLGKKEHAKLALESYIKAGFNSLLTITSLLCITKSTDCVDMAIEAGVDFTYSGENKVPNNLFFGTKDVEFTKYVLERTKIKPNFIHSLNVAIIRRNIDMIKFVLEKIENSKVNEYYSFNHTITSDHFRPLQIAAVVELIPIMEILLTKFDINESSQDGATALHFAAVTGNIELFNYMISKGADLRKETINGCTVLHLAALHGRLEIVKRIVELTGTELLNKVDRITKLTPISASIVCMKNKDRRVFDFLLSSGSKLNVEGTLTPLMCAIDNIHTDEGLILELLENPTIDVNAEVECIRGKANALHYAIGNGLNNIARILIDKGARCTDSVRDEIPDIGSAILWMERDVSLRLITEKRYKESDEYPAMMFAVAKGDSALVSAILEESERPEDIETGMYEMTPLKVAVMEGNAHLVDMLIKKGANINASYAINPDPYIKESICDYQHIEKHGIYNLMPTRNAGSHFSFASYEGTAAQLALWNGNPLVLEVMGLQGPGMEPPVTSQYINAHEYFRSSSIGRSDKSSVAFTSDYRNPNAGNLYFGDNKYYCNTPITGNEINSLFSNGDVTISCPCSSVPFFPKVHYL